MATAWRIVLWILVVIAPGGVLLLPILAADALKRRAASAPLVSERSSMPPERPSRIELAPAQAG